MLEQIDSFSGEHRFLSNFFPSPIESGGATYPTVEHAFQAFKTHDTNDRVAILEASTPGKAKRLGKKVTLRRDWERIKITVMKLLLVHKFQISELRQKLIDTGDAELIEGNGWGDTFWGVYQGMGSNHLGILLMEIRDFAQWERKHVKV